MRSLTTDPTTLALAGAVLLGVTGSAVRADNFTWDNSCGDNYWSTCCELGGGGDPYMANNWALATPPWPACPPLPGVADDVYAGGLVILSDIPVVNSFAGSGTFRIEAGGLTVNLDATYGGPVDWSGGGFGGGEHFVNADLNLTGTNIKTIAGGTVYNAHNATWTGTGNIHVIHGATFNNLAGATFDVQNDVHILYSSGNSSVFNNAGTFVKSAGAGNMRIGGLIQFNNTGIVNVQSGRLRLAVWNGNSSGTYNLDAGTSVDFVGYPGGIHTLQDGANFTGPGFARIDDCSLYVADGALATAENFEFSGGALRGTGTLSISDTFTWTGGTMTDAGITRVENTAGMSISGSAVKRLSGPHVLENAGTATWTGTGDMHFANAGVFNNLAGATFDAQNDANIWYGGGDYSVFNNAGTFVKSAGAGTTRIGAVVQFNNTGVVNVQSGTLGIVGWGATARERTTWMPARRWISSTTSGGPRTRFKTEPASSARASQISKAAVYT